MSAGVDDLLVVRNQIVDILFFFSFICFVITEIQKTLQTVILLSVRLPAWLTVYFACPSVCLYLPFYLPVFSCRQFTCYGYHKGTGRVEMCVSLPGPLGVVWGGVGWGKG